MQPTQVNLNKFYGDGDWKIVEGILKECLAKISYDVDNSTAPTDFKAQTIANKRLHEAVVEFLRQAKVIVDPSIGKDNWI